MSLAQNLPPGSVPITTYWMIRSDQTILGVSKLRHHLTPTLEMHGGHIAYYIPSAGIAFVGDSVFALGCGRMFEGTPKQFWASLERIKALPPETTLYCAHEYTAANAKFALHADPDNTALKAYADEIAVKRERGEPTVPTQLDRELATNPFLRADDPALMAKWGGTTPPETFAALREAKDNF